MDRDQSPSFLGRGWSFPPELDSHNGTAVMVTAEEDIQQSLRILMETRPGERVMHPEYGCRLRDYVFDTMDATTKSSIEAAIFHAILFFETRIALLSVTADTQDWIEGRLFIRLEYRVRETNQRSNIVFPFYLTEGTLVSGMPEAAA